MLSYKERQINKNGFYQYVDKPSFRLSLTELREGDIKTVENDDTLTVYVFKGGAFRIQRIYKKEWYVECKKKYRLI